MLGTALEGVSNIITSTNGPHFAELPDLDVGMVSKRIYGEATGGLGVFWMMHRYPN